jgi:hypothetical protein
MVEALASSSAGLHISAGGGTGLLAGFGSWSAPPPVEGHFAAEGAAPARRQPRRWDDATEPAASCAFVHAAPPSAAAPAFYQCGDRTRAPLGTACCACGPATGWSSSTRAAPRVGDTTASASPQLKRTMALLDRLDTLRGA